jgi:simple sugar transport system permease protein
MMARLLRSQGDVLGLAVFMAVVLLFFGLTTPRFWSVGTFQSVAYQLPELGLLTLAMLLPILSGGLNLAITFTANISALAMAAIIQAGGGPEAGALIVLFGMLAALVVGGLAGWVMGVIVAFVGAHPILVSLGMMIFLQGLGEFLTRGGDISGFPPFIATIGHGSILGIPTPLLIFLVAAVFWQLMLSRSRFGFSVYMLGSNPEATRYSGIDTRRVLVLIYLLSGVMSALAGILMLTRFNSVRVGHGESYLLITVLACFLGGVDPFGGFGRTVAVVLALVILQTIASGLNLMGAHQHLATALWGLFLVGVMVARWVWLRWAGRSP